MVSREALESADWRGGRRLGTPRAGAAGEAVVLVGETRMEVPPAVHVMRAGRKLRSSEELARARHFPLADAGEAACMRRSSSASPPATAREFAALPRAARNKASQSPRWKATTLSKSACLPSSPFCPTRASSMRGAST